MSEICMSFPFRMNQQGGVTTTKIGSTTHVEEHITQILTTRKGERLMHPEYGCNIDYSLFDNIEPSLYRILVLEVVESLNKFEPRINVEAENLSITVDNSVVTIHMTYELKLDGSLNEYTVQLT